MKLRIPSIFFQNSAIFWLGITLLLWWLGIAGRDLYLIPAIVFLLASVFQIIIGKFSNNSINWIIDYSKKRYFIGLYWIHAGLFLATTILKYYSFRWNIWDVGNHSNMVFNISRGTFYSSYLGVHNWADHFTPSMSPLAFFYLLNPSTHWITLAKTFSYLSVPFLIYKICKESFSEKEKAWIVALFIGAAWMLFYSPAVNSLYYEFQPSSLAPPFVLYAFLCFQRKRWIYFWIIMLIILGFKEHLGAVWIGLGSLMIVTTNYKKTGIILISGGIISIYVIMFQLMPFFRNFEEPWSMSIGPFQDIPEKLIYLVKIFLPLGFLPLIFWRFGILAGPAIGVNLLSNNHAMFSTRYHYDDIVATLLMVAMVLIFSSKWQKLKLLDGKKVGEWFLVGWCVCVMGLLTSSPLREFYTSIPEKFHLDIRKELIKFDQFSKEEYIAVQTSLGPQFNRTNILAITQDSNGKCSPMKRDLSIPEPKYLVFARSLNHYLIENLDQCLNNLNLSKNYKILQEYQYLEIFEKK